MSLNYNLSAIPDWKTACFEELSDTPENMKHLVEKVTFAGPDWRYTDESKTSIERMRVTAQVLIFATMSVGLGSITEKNAEEFYTRLAMLERVDGAYRRDENDKPTFFTREEVRAHIGLRVNVIDESKAPFHARVARALRERVS